MPKPETAAPKRGFPERKPLTKAQMRERAEARALKEASVRHPAPDEMRTLTVCLYLRTLHDGTIHPGFKAETIKGRWDNEDARRFDMMVYDPQTAAAIVTRLASVTYSANVARRLPPEKVFRVILAARSDKDGNIGCSIRQVARQIKKEGKKPVYKAIERDADAYRAKDPNQLVLAKFRRASRLLRGAFVDAQPIPGAREYQQMLNRVSGSESE